MTLNAKLEVFSLPNQEFSWHYKTIDNVRFIPKTKNNPTSLNLSQKGLHVYIWRQYFENHKRFSSCDKCLCLIIKCCNYGSGTTCIGAATTVILISSSYTKSKTSCSSSTSKTLKSSIIFILAFSTNSSKIDFIMIRHCQLGKHKT